MGRPVPDRIQLRRVKGWRKPEGVIVVARPTRWGNPFRGTDDLPVTAFRMWIADPEQAELRAAVRTELRGRDLACWCRPDQPCHADVLLELANA